MYMREKVVAIIIIVLLAGCGRKSVEKISQNISPSIMETFPYANSTDIYTSTARYALDGSKRKGLNLIGTDGLDCSILPVDDKWLYYYSGDEEGTGNLKRIPLQKGADKRDVVDLKKAENVRDTQYEHGFTVTGNYYAGISYGTVALLYNMNTREIIRCKIPKDLSYTKDVEPEDKYWCVLEQGKDWILWERDHGVMLQKIPTGELYTVEKKKHTMFTAKRNDCVIYSTNKKSCYLYDVKDNSKKIFMEEKQIRKAICSGMNIPETELHSCCIDNLMVKEDKFCMQLKIKIKKRNTTEEKYVILSQKQGENDFFVYDKFLNSILRKCAEKRYKKEEKKKADDEKIRFVMNVDGFWFLQGNDFYCYNTETGLVKEINENDTEWNVAYAVYKDGLEDGYD